MNLQNYQGTFIANIPLTAAFEGVSKRVPEWWTNNFEGSSENLGDVFTVRFGETFGTYEITEMAPNEKIVWLTTNCNLHFLKDKKEWKGTQIVWEFAATGNATQVTMTHVGLTPALECFEDCTGGWNHYVKGSLYKLLTEGKGEPDHEDYSAKYKQ